MVEQGVDGQMVAEIEVLQRHLQAEHTRRIEAERVLRPFAEALAAAEPADPDDAYLSDLDITVGQLRAAAQHFDRYERSEDGR